MLQHETLKCLDELLAELGGVVTGTRTMGRCGALLEHLQGARRGLLGSMSGEYLLSLQQAKVSLDCISDKSVRAEVKKTLRRLEEPTRRSSPSPVSAH
jgi:hypothetical protein